MKTSLLMLALLTALASCTSDYVSPSLPTNKPELSTGGNEIISVFKKTKVSWADTD